MILEAEWSDLKDFVDAKDVNLQYIETGSKYVMVAIDGNFSLSCHLRKNGDADVTDFETNYKPEANKKLDKSDPETGGLRVTNKFAPDGWLQRLHEIEFTTSTVGGAIHDKDVDNNDYGWSSVKMFEGAHGSETEITGANLTDQSYLDANCTRTDFSWMPDIDYMILSGVISQFSIPANDLYMWGLFLDTDPALHGMGILPVEILGGGLNMKGVNERDRVGLKGVSGSIVYYGGVMTPNGYVATGDGLGTNRIRFVLRHDTGLKHTFQSIFEVFRS